MALPPLELFSLEKKPPCCRVAFSRPGGVPGRGFWKSCSRFLTAMRRAVCTSAGPVRSVIRRSASTLSTIGQLRNRVTADAHDGGMLRASSEMWYRRHSLCCACVELDQRADDADCSHLTWALSSGRSIWALDSRSIATARPAARGTQPALPYGPGDATIH
jgi:hypothetical protein